MLGTDPNLLVTQPRSVAPRSVTEALHMAAQNRRSRCVAAVVFLLLAILVGCGRQPVSPNAAATVEALMTPEELAALPSRAPDRRIAYGTDSSQYGELRIPAGTGPHPLVVLIHGGCFKAAYATAQYFGAMADVLKADGIATWNIEYRRLGEPGGGWPGTYLDVGRAVDHVRVIADEYDLDLARVVVVGHSAGGHLAMWTAARRRLPAASELSAADPLPVRGVIDLAGPVDMTANIPGYEALCRDTVITSLLGGTPATVPDRYAHASPITMLPLAIPQVIVLGSREEYVPLPLVDAYVQAATQAGDQVRRILIPGAGHFEIASPLSVTWPPIESAIRLLIDGKLPS
jgi:acetyl esterase/lipase